MNLWVAGTCRIYSRKTRYFCIKGYWSGQDKLAAQIKKVSPKPFWTIKLYI